MTGDYRDYPGSRSRIMRDPNEPSVHDHNAPYNEEDYIDENGEECSRCACTSCKRQREREARANYEP